MVPVSSNLIPCSLRNIKFFSTPGNLLLKRLIRYGLDLWERNNERLEGQQEYHILDIARNMLRQLYGLRQILPEVLDRSWIGSLSSQ